MLTQSVQKDTLDLNALGLEELLFWTLSISDISLDTPLSLRNETGVFSTLIRDVAGASRSYFRDGERETELFESIRKLRDFVYRNGTPRQLLFADIVCALIRKRYDNSTWSSLPKYSTLSVDRWRPIFKKPSFIHELWPAQHLLGQSGIFAGNSAIVQMPTSAGKTRAIEIVIRSGFLSQRASTVVVVAPFRALCHEISTSLNSSFAGEAVRIDEFSDVLQVDFQASEKAGGHQIWIVTPEKLLYMLRQVPSLAERIGLLIYDEGHQFDNDSRGVTYELLLTSLKALVPVNIQVVLISAVINNVDVVKQWLAPEAQVVTGLNLVPTYRTVAFTSWLDQRGRLEFVTPSQPNHGEFFVPRVLEQHELELRPNERKRRMFPAKDDSQAIALYLGLKLVKKGSVAIFCGTKRSAVKCCQQIVDAYERKLHLAKPSDISTQQEVQKLAYLHELNLGAEADITRSARIGVFAHHGNVPHGIRLAIEHALKEGLIRYVVCTSTLAQGVNLPIRYLILSNIYQARERIKVRDFHNLIGRAGRSGMHTEGSIIFADPTIYESRKTDSWKWQQATELLLPENSEPCLSTLLSLFESLENDDRNNILDMDAFALIRLYIEGIDRVNRFVDENSNEQSSADTLRDQVTKKLRIISAIESYLLAYWDDSELEGHTDSISELAAGTFAYFLADNDKKNTIIHCFRLLAENIRQQVPLINKRKVFGRTLYGVWTSIAIENWVRRNFQALLDCNSHKELLLVIWPLLDTYIANQNFNKCEPADALIAVATQWIEGQSFHLILARLVNINAKLRAKSQRRNFHTEHIVDICENGLSFDGGLVVSAVIEMVGLLKDVETGNLIRNLQELQKRLKYGLPSLEAISLYEVGFADRVIAMELSATIGVVPRGRNEIASTIRNYEKPLRDALSHYPVYFEMQLENLLG